MIRLLSVACCFLLASARLGVRDYGYHPCEGKYVGEGYYNLAGESPYNRQVEMVCDFSKSRVYDRVTNIAWVRLDEYDGCRRTEPFGGEPHVLTKYGTSRLTINNHSGKDHGIYRCFGTVDSGRYNDIGRRRVVYMDVKFTPSKGYRYDRHRF